MGNEKMTPQKSISIIEDAMRKAQHEKTGARFYLILWGILIVIYALTAFINLRYPSTATATLSSLAWIVFPLGGLLSILRARKDDRTETTKPLNDSLYMFAWGGTGLCMGATLFFAFNSKNLDIIPPVILLIFGFAAFVTGGVTRFYPSLVGGIISILIGAAMFNLILEYQLLAGSAGILAATVIPGLLMKK
jgi:hypothetical protein